MGRVTKHRKVLEVPLLETMINCWNVACCFLKAPKREMKGHLWQIATQVYCEYFNKRTRF